MELALGYTESPNPGTELLDTSTSSAESCSSEMSLVTMDNDALKSQYKPDYNLRKSSIVNRILTEKRQNSPKQPKLKAKPPPLSKYRRRAANSRERNRMQDINGAFEELQSVVPSFGEELGSKMTKITTLRLALNYIAALRDILGYEDDLNSDASSTRSSSVSSGDEHCLSPTGDLQNSDSFSEHSNIDSESESLVLHL